MHTIDELREKQALPLNLKISMTQSRIRAWVNEYGLDGVYVSFSGGKDSTVLLDIARKMYPDIKAMFVDVPTQFPELKQFAQTFENVDIVKPKISFAAVCEQYGFPLISKEVAESVYGARQYLKALTEQINGGTLLTDSRRINISTIKSADTASTLNLTRGGTTVNGVNSEELASLLNERMKHKAGGANQRLAIMLGWLTRDKKNPIRVNIPSGEKSAYSHDKYKFLLESPFDIGNQCCTVFKKEPSHRYSKETGRNPITAQMAVESRLRTQKWLENGCNGFHMKQPVSNPMSFWLEQDVLKYIYENKLPICSVYGDVVEETDGQMSLADLGLMEREEPKYKCTGCKRTGCCLCCFGAHLEKSPNRFQQLHETHPKMYGLLDHIKNNGVTYREAIEWVNEHGNGVHIEL